MYPGWSLETLLDTIDRMQHLILVACVFVWHSGLSLPGNASVHCVQCFPGMKKKAMVIVRMFTVFFISFTFKHPRLTCSQGHGQLAAPVREPVTQSGELRHCTGLVHLSFSSFFIHLPAYMYTFAIRHFPSNHGYCP